MPNLTLWFQSAHVCSSVVCDCSLRALLPVKSVFLSGDLVQPSPRHPLFTVRFRQKLLVNNDYVNEHDVTIVSLTAQAFGMR